MYYSRVKEGAIVLDRITGRRGSIVENDGRYLFVPDRESLLEKAGLVEITEQNCRIFTCKKDAPSEAPLLMEYDVFEGHLYDQKGEPVTEQGSIEMLSLVGAGYGTLFFLEKVEEGYSLSSYSLTRDRFERGLLTVSEEHYKEGVQFLQLGSEGIAFMRNVYENDPETGKKEFKHSLQVLFLVDQINTKVRVIGAGVSGGPELNLTGTSGSMPLPDGRIITAETSDGKFFCRVLDPDGVFSYTKTLDAEPENFIRKDDTWFYITKNGNSYVATGEIEEEPVCFSGMAAAVIANTGKLAEVVPIENGCELWFVRVTEVNNIGRYTLAGIKAVSSKDRGLIISTI